MKKIGLFYGGTTAKTAVVALKIQEAFTENEVVLIPIEGATRKEFESFDNIIAGNRIHRHDGQESRTIRARRPRTLSRQFRRWDRHSGGSLYQKQCGADRFHACQRSPLHPITGRQGRTFPGTSPRYREPVRTNGGTDTEMGGETEKGVSIIFAFVSALDRELCRSKILLTNRYNLGTDFTENTEKINSSV